MAEAAGAIGEKLEGDRTKHMESEVAKFKTHLEEFAVKHRDKINQDPEFRRSFAQMTASIGIDPLASSKGFWAEMLGIGDFYYDLGVQAVDVCIRTRPINGGIISLVELTRRITAMRVRPGMAAITTDDVRRALDKIKCLGGGYRVVALNEARASVTAAGGAGEGPATASGSLLYVVSTVDDVDQDQFDVLRIASAPGPQYGWASIESLGRSSLRWEAARASRVLHALLRSGMAWLDRGAGGGGGSSSGGGVSGERYYFPAITYSEGDGTPPGGGAAATGGGAGGK